MEEFNQSAADNSLIFFMLLNEITREVEDFTDKLQNKVLLKNICPTVGPENISLSKIKQISSFIHQLNLITNDFIKGLEE